MAEKSNLILYNSIKYMKSKIKAMLRNWLFANYKWVTRAQIQGEIASLQWKYKDYPLVLRVLNELKEVVK